MQASKKTRYQNVVPAKTYQKWAKAIHFWEEKHLTIVIALLAAGATVLCYSCLTQAAKADEYAEHQYQDYVKERNMGK